jgi:phosphatidate cytidylyltransferase
MKRVLTAALLIPVVLLLVFKAPLWLYALVVAVIIVLALREYLGIVKAAGIKPFGWLTYAVSLFPIGFFLYSYSYSSRHGYFVAPDYSGPFFPIHWFGLLAVSTLIFGIPLVIRKDLTMGLAASAASLFGVIYIGLSLSLLISLEANFIPTLTLLLLLSVWAGDIAAYYVGKNFGRNKLAPIVSPNKSWEGAIASVVASVGMAWLVLHFNREILDFVFRLEGANAHLRQLLAGFSPRVGLRHALPLGILTNVAAQFGDLFESALKRGAGVKDSGTLLPGHGGMLDRIDALLFAIPVVWYYATQTGLLTKMYS